MSAHGGATQGPAHPPRLPFEYALVRVVPRIERGESINVGVLLYSQATDYLGAAVHIDERRLVALDPTIDVESVRASVNAVVAVCSGGLGGGPASEGNAGVRFRWLVAPRSTVVQFGPIHSGVTSDPTAELHRLLNRLVR